MILLSETVDPITNAIAEWAFNAVVGFFRTTNLPNSLSTLGNAIFNSTIGFCTGYLGTSPIAHFSDAWLYVFNLGKGDVAIGIANDIFIIFFLVSLIEHATAIHNKLEVEDIFKMFARALVAQYLIFNSGTLASAISSVSRDIIAVINPQTDSFFTEVYLPDASGTFAWLIWIVNLILSLVYLVTLVIISFKIVSSFFERYIWFFFGVPFAAPAFATIAGTGKFSSTAKAYVRFMVAIFVEMIAFAILANLLSYMVGGFTSYINSWISDAIVDLGDGWTWVSGYLSNLCLASMIYSAFTKLDSKVEKMYGL